MVEFGIVNVQTNETEIMFGYNAIDAFKRAGLKMDEWTITYCDYVD